MNFEVPLGMVAFAALLISTGIITVATSTFMSGAAQKVFEKVKIKDRPMGATYAHRSEIAAKLQDQLQSFPGFLKILYIGCHSPIFLFMAILMVCDAFYEMDIREGRLYFGDTLSASKPLEFLALFALFMLIGYLVMLIWSVLRIKLGFVEMLAEPADLESN